MRQATVWEMPTCPTCARVKSVLKRRGHEVEVRSLEALLKGQEPDNDAMVALALADGKAPLVRVDGRMLEETEIEALDDRA